ncbi:SAM-dependent methyltransferase [Ruficoccus sp. ZRK36]|uniref:SAM-dependent methyltransferase n=1 Tax=Ruficoccus sp. ZRK36 TaxID=2866311 RepID=UPI001C72FBD6|nr:SAM-dependent methyltransferase [Ruficoccus sp. ZRK36]QYY36339.1 SAM-dependent methyltransferase [Ruficoccus sp. ZRK36]
MSASFQDVLREAASPDGLLSYADFTRLALYHPEYGYYLRSRERVGRSQDTDFYTAASLGGVFARLLREAIAQLLPGQSSDYALVELGVEPGKGTLAAQAGDFAAYHEIGAGQDMQMPERAVVFANELLDAQPFHRFIYQHDTWQERGVKVDAETLSDTLLPSPSPEAQPFLSELPPSSEGYRLDISLEAETLLAQIGKQVREGLLIFFDYGKSWPLLLEASPAGSARAYYRHELSDDLLARPGEQDLTCHVCWDRLATALESAGWARPRLESQEGFFVHNATAEIERIITAQGSAFDPDRQTLKELIYPGHMGRKFQVLFAQSTSH